MTGAGGCALSKDVLHAESLEGSVRAESEQVLTFSGKPFAAMSLRVSI